MEVKNGENRSSEGRQSSDISDFEARPRRMGDASGIGVGHGTNQITVGGNDSNQGNTFVPRGQTDEGIAGKIIRQLIDETEKQLAYHKNQVEALESRLVELNQIPTITSDSN